MSEQTQKMPQTPTPETPLSGTKISGTKTPERKTLGLGGGRLTLGSGSPPRHGMSQRGHSRDVKVEVVRRRPTSSFRKMPPPSAAPTPQPQTPTAPTTPKDTHLNATSTTGARAADTSTTGTRAAESTHSTTASPATAPETTTTGIGAEDTSTEDTSAAGLGSKTTDSAPKPSDAPAPRVQPSTADSTSAVPSNNLGQHRFAPADEPRLTIERANRGQSKRREATGQPKKPNLNRREPVVRRRGKITITEALGGGETIRQRSLASVRRARMRDKARSRDQQQPKIKQIREVIIPDVITVQELSNRMAERAASTIKELMRLGILATAPQTIDAETAELVVLEMGHKVRRVSDADVDIITNSDDDDPASLKPRPPVVTVMGHVDHGKTSILDAIRKADVALGEEGGITQHIGAYQINSDSGNTITFIDTPGHEAFTEMRVRGANITDIVVLVVAADDGVMPQTVEAIAHAKAAGCPIIVAINKCDKPDADPKRIRNELLNHEVITEEYGGDTLAVEISAKQGTGLDALEEAIMLQAELLELKTNPDRTAEAAVIEAKMERGRGSVASVLVTRGTLKIGDIFVVGAEMGRVRAMVDASGRTIAEARPGDAVEVLGLGGTPLAGDSLTVVETEARAREVAQYRNRRRNKDNTTIGATIGATIGRGSVEAMLSALAAGEAEELPLVLKTDVHGSLEAIRTAIDKLSTEQVKARILSSSVGAINESDINLAAASAGLVLAFNVRANPQARNQARRDGVEIRYHSIIYQLLDEVKAAMSGLLSPLKKEEFIGYAEIREVFSISKIGKIAGCMITEGIIKRGCKVRLLRNSVVVHEGALKTLKRFKDEVGEAREGQECGMAFENYDDIAVGDVIECFEIINIARTIDG